MSTDSYKKVKLVLWTILFANLAVAALKIVVGSVIKSASMTADGFHSLTDGSSNIIGLIGISIASKPVDEDHPYGHKKFETLAGIFIAGLLFLAGAKVLVEAVTRFFNPVVPEVSALSLITLIITLVINIFVSVYESKQGKKLNSYILISDSMHTRSDIYVSIGVLATLFCIKLGLPPIIDTIASLVVTGFIIHAAVEIFKSNSDVLVDKAAVNIDDVKNIVMEFEQVKDAHDIRSRGREDDLHIDMHIMTDPDMSIEESHELIHNIEKRLQDKINKDIHVIVHFEPFGEESHTKMEI